MTAYRQVTDADVEGPSSALHTLKGALEADRLGVTVARPEPNWTSTPHDHAESGHEEVYLLLDGRATVRVDGDPVRMEPGDALLVEPEATRQIHNGGVESTFLLVSAPECDRPLPDDVAWDTDSVQG